MCRHRLTTTRPTLMDGSNCGFRLTLNEGTHDEWVAVGGISESSAYAQLGVSMDVLARLERAKLVYDTIQIVCLLRRSNRVAPNAFFGQRKAQRIAYL